MQQLFVELYNYKQSWRDLPPQERQAFVSKLAESLPLIERMGVEILGYGANEPATPNRAPYDFFSVYRAPSAEVLQFFQTAINDTGWYDYFEQVNVAGADAGRYGFATHMEYFSGLMRELGLTKDVVLVGHDWGANIAFEWARQNPNAVSGIAFTEPLLPPFGWEDWQPAMVEEFRYLRTPEGEADVLENNFFLRRAPVSMTRMLTPAELAEIERPYATEGEDRRPTSDWPREGALR